MFTKGNTVYADAYKYLRHKDQNIIALSIKGSANDYEELELDHPLDVEVSGDMIFWNRRMFANIPDALTREAIKTSIIKSRYSNDDQLAILLNKDEDEMSTMYYQKMQEWREFASEVSKILINAYKAGV